MKVKALAMAGFAGSFIMTGSATAALTGVSFAVVDQSAPAGTTYRFYANFDDPTDQLLSVSGNENVGSFLMTTNTVLINAGGGFDGLKAEDFAGSPISMAWDSWVTIGSTAFAGNDTDYSPDFLGSDGTNAIILGSTLSQVDNGGWFDGNPTTPEDGGTILIAQFTVANKADGSRGEINMTGTIDYNPAGSPPAVSEFFEIRTPAPGALRCSVSPASPARVVVAAE